jgi:hypothetical protein
MGLLCLKMVQAGLPVNSPAARERFFRAPEIGARLLEVGPERKRVREVLRGLANPALGEAAQAQVVLGLRAPGIERHRALERRDRLVDAPAAEKHEPEIGLGAGASRLDARGLTEMHEGLVQPPLPGQRAPIPPWASAESGRRASALVYARAVLVGLPCASRATPR